MSVKIENIPNEPFIICTYSDPLDAVVDTQAANEAGEALAHEFPTGTIYVIADMSEAHITFATLVQGLAQASRGNGGTLKNPRLKTIAVGSGKIIDIAVSAA